MILFLDFDNTLHPLWTFDERPDRVIAIPYAGPLLIEAPTLERILKPYLDRIEIVISSLRAYHGGLDATRNMLPIALAERVTDSIWLPGFHSDYHSMLCTRFGCIQMWLKHRRPDHDGPWLALDDEDSGWPEAERHHLVHAWGTLSNPKVQEELAEKLAELC